MGKVYETKCSWCDSIFHHWRLRQRHERSCKIRFAQSEHFRRSTAHQKPEFHGPEMTEAEAFKGFTDKEGE